MELNTKELYKLNSKLKKANIPCELIEQRKDNVLYFQVVVKWNCYSIDAVIMIMQQENQFFFSIGGEKGKLEIMGGLTRKELGKSTVKGNLTANQAFRRIKWCYKHNTPIYRDKKWRTK